MKKALVVLSLALLATACSSTPEEKAQAQAEKDELISKATENKKTFVSDKGNKYICTTKRQIGSHFNKRRCITAEAKKKEQEEAKKAMRNLDRSWHNHTGG